MNMYNERNILTMSDEEIKNNTLSIADKFNLYLASFNDNIPESNPTFIASNCSF